MNGHRRKVEAMEINLPGDMRRAIMGDLDQLADITAEAFSEDPINLWIFGHARAMKPAFRTLAKALYLKNGFCHLHGDDGATMWIESEKIADPSTLSMLGFAWAMRRHGTKGAMKRAIGAGEAMKAHHPKERHLYLFTVGTRKSSRGKGIGSALLRPVLDAADKQGRACHLENTNPENSGFYGAHGFKRLETFEIGTGSPPMEAMWREPKPQAQT